ncbi:MAG: hypothetical protein ACTS73_04240 [Arsenophonus sp. NEOnobi-MAG3]
MHFAKKTKGAWHSVKYLGSTLKRPPQYLRQNYGINQGGGKCAAGGGVLVLVHHYYDHRTKQ